MDDSISRQAALNALCDNCDTVQAVCPHFPCKRYTSIEVLPSAQPVRMKGQWIHDGYDFPHGNDWIHCSVCGKKGINVPADLTNFCSNCGADMRGGQDE